MPHDPWKTWSDALTLLGREESYLKIGAIGALGMLARTNEELAGPTVAVLQSALKEWESKEPGPPAGVKDAARALLDTLATAEDREAERRPALWRRLGRRLGPKTP
ncbi:hypothetical protein ACH4TS_22425 [Streptomyces albidoflavus]|uniref:hypothetical protein n=1 Tax=Streptomyces sp. B29(2018) TaxID=2485016 RepID=UPI000FD666DD|nr:hypothetical protein [Streptomyces sp. B29(2018)]